jgi:hypothetical protein
MDQGQTQYVAIKNLIQEYNLVFRNCGDYEKFIRKLIKILKI